MKRTLYILLTVALAAACQPSPDTAVGTAEAFLDRHYVSMDLASARTLCADLALTKLDREIALTRDQAILEDTAKPHINYKQRFANEHADTARYEYELQISATGMEPFKKQALLSLRNTDGRWRVTNYSESDP